MGRQDEVVGQRLKKLEELRKLGINPYTPKVSRTHAAAILQKEHVHLKPGEKTKEKVHVVGRVISVRDLGKIAFATLDDGSAKIQVTLQEGESPEKMRELFRRYVDAGDFIGVGGTVFRTQRGELSVLVQEVTIATKSIYPLPEKWHGITDDEERLRKRYLDILMNPEVKALFIRKSKFWQAMRSFLLERGFLEVETPVLENSAGGASATPFATHHNALDIDVYLRISMGELWQKKLMVAGFEKTFEIGRQFRNEGMDAEHLQDYTQMEFYWGYANYLDGMALVEEMYKHLAQSVWGTTKFTAHNHTFDLGKKWDVIDYTATIKKETGIDIFKATEKEMEKKLHELKQEIEPNAARARLIDTLWKYCRKKISGPVFLTGQPVEVSPLAKRDPQDGRKVQQFQIILAGSELGNGYSELNDPLDQEGRFEEQRKMKEAGDNEAQDHDESFIEALKYGMPPTCGFGVSERLFSFLEGKPIRECVIFPLMRPMKESLSKKEAEELYRSKKVVVIADEKLNPGITANAMGQLGISIGGHSKEKLFEATVLHDADKRVHYTDCFYPMVNYTGTQEQMAEFAHRCYAKGVQFFDFTDVMRKAHSDEEMQKGYGAKKTKELGYIAVGALVPADFEKEFLSKLKLFGSEKEVVKKEAKKHGGSHRKK